MRTCDALIVGGGPSGSTCAWQLIRAGLDVIVLDAATFPRDKPCAGWITPRVVEDLELDVDNYRVGRAFQPISGFRVGSMSDAAPVTTHYDRPVSYAIRRCEFDSYLLTRARAVLRSGVLVQRLERRDGLWIVNGDYRAPWLIGAGGHFCPVARHLNRRLDSSNLPTVVAQEAEWLLDGDASALADDRVQEPLLLFCDDLKGYGWIVGKGRFVNVGFGRLNDRALRQAVAAFQALLTRRGWLPPNPPARWRGHAYVVRDRRHRIVAGDGVVLVGDAAGLANPRSGEGIGPAVRSGLAVARCLAGTSSEPARHDAIAAYAQRLFPAVRPTLAEDVRLRFASSPAGHAAGRWLLRVPPFVRSVVLDRWFLDRADASRRQPGLYADAAAETMR